jgi:hypothetical protein
MTITKKGIVVKRQTYSEGATELKSVHTLSDDGVFSIGNDPTDAAVNNIQLKGVLTIVGPNGSADSATDVHLMMTNVDTAITTLTGSESTAYNAIDQDVTDFEGLIGIADDGTRSITQPVWTALHASGSALAGTETTFKAVDTKLDIEAKDVADRIATLNGTGATSVRGLIAKQVNGSVDGSTLEAIDATAIDTIWEIQKAFMTGTDDAGVAPGEAGYSGSAWASLDVVTQEINPTSVSSSLNSYIEEAEADMIDSVAAGQNTLAKLATMLDIEINTTTGRYVTKDLLLRKELSQACTTTGVANAETATDAMDATLTFDFNAAATYATTAGNQLAASQIANSATLKAADEQISLALEANRIRLNGLESHLNLSGDLTIKGAVTLTGLSFGDDAGKMSMPSMTATEARAKFGAFVPSAPSNDQVLDSGKMVFITTGNVADDEFTQDKKFYFCEKGRWLPSSFVVSS